MPDVAPLTHPVVDSVVMPVTEQVSECYSEYRVGTLCQYPTR